MTVVTQDVDSVRIDVYGTLAAIALVERLRRRRPRVQPLQGAGWQICVACGDECEEVLETIRDWLRAEQLVSTTVLVHGAPRLLAA